jgi:hypothetical protein
MLSAPADCNGPSYRCQCAAACTPGGWCANEECPGQPCGEAYNCLAECSDYACQEACFASANDEAAQLLDEMLDCFSRECDDAADYNACVTTECDGELDRCFSHDVSPETCDLRGDGCGDGLTCQIDDQQLAMCELSGGVAVGDSCTTPAQCTDGATCVDGRCLAWCLSGGDCDAAQTCAPIPGQAGVCCEGDECPKLPCNTDCDAAVESDDSEPSGCRGAAGSMAWLPVVVWIWRRRSFRRQS